MAGNAIVVLTQNPISQNFAKVGFCSTIPNMDEQTINAAYDKLAKTRVDMWGAIEQTIRARLDVEKERGARVMTGEIVGKNEAERDARARELLHSLFAALESAEADERRARLEHDLAKIEVERVELIVRLLSAMPAATP